MLVGEKPILIQKLGDQEKKLEKERENVMVVAKVVVVGVVVDLVDLVGSQSLEESEKFLGGHFWWKSQSQHRPYQNQGEKLGEGEEGEVLRGHFFLK